MKAGDLMLYTNDQGQKIKVELLEDARHPLTTVKEAGAEINTFTDVRGLTQQGGYFFARTKQLTPLYRVLSPDGFDIERDGEYNSHEEAKEALNRFIERFKVQGYYSTASRERISLNHIAQYCKIIQA